MSAARHTSPDPENEMTVPLVTAGISDRCSVCGAHMAADQRYCVDCGTRRGAPRFELAGQGMAAGLAPASASTPVRAGGLRGFLRSSSGVVLFVTVLIVLVAVGVGVLIGHDGNSRTTPPKYSIVINGGGSGGSSGSTAGTGNSGASAPAGGSSASSSSGSGASTKSASKSKSAKVKATPKAVTKSKVAATSAADKFSKSATNKSTLGGSCTKGTAGCSSSGQQTGNLFGG